MTEPVAAPEVVTTDPVPAPTELEPRRQNYMEPEPLIGNRRAREAPDFGVMRRHELVTHLRGHPYHLRDGQVRNLRVGEMEELARSLHNNLHIQ